MRTRSTERGIALIVLIVIIVLVGVLSAGIVAIMGAKQRSYPIQAQSYQALNLANAGAEFAIRYAYDQYKNYGASVGTSLGSPITVSLGTGSFEIKYEGGTGYILRSTGICGGAKREVHIHRFPGFVQGSGLVLTDVIDSGYPPIQGCYNGEYCPGQQNQNISIPLTNLYDRDIYIKGFEITLEPGQGSDNLIAGVYFGSSLIYDPDNETNNPNYEKKGNKGYICIPTAGHTGCNSNSITPAKIPYGYNLNARIPPGSVLEILDFKSASIRGQYTIKFFYDFETTYTNLQSTTVTFNIN